MGHDLSAAGGVTNEHCFMQVEELDEGGKVVGVGVHVITVPGLGGTAMAAAIMGDDAVTTLAEKEHLRVPGIGV